MRSQKDRLMAREPEARLVGMAGFQSAETVPAPLWKTALPD